VTRLALLAALAATFALAAASSAQATTLPAGFQEVTLADDFNAPGEAAIVDTAWAPDGRMFVADRAGMVFVHNPGAPAGQNQVLLDINDHVNNGAGSDRGLLGIAVDRDFASNGYLYLLYTYDKSGTDSDDWAVSTLRRVTVHPDNSVTGGATDPTETTILGQIPDTYGSDPNVGVCGTPSNTNQCIPSEGLSHSIGTVRVADDGTLFVGTGDGNDYLEVDPLTQWDDNEQTYRGKIMHIDRNGNGLAGHPFCTGDNTLTDVCTKLYAKGLRNPFRFTVRPGGGLAIGDVGQDAFEEFDVANGGEDFGWPCWEGMGHTPYEDPHTGDRYDQTSWCQDRYAQPDTTTKPLVAWTHVPYPIDQNDCTTNAPRGNTSIGGPTYTGDRYPADYRGVIFFGDWTCQWVYSAVMSGNTVTSIQPFAGGWDGGVDLEIAPDGNLAWIVDNEVREVTFDRQPSVSPSATATAGLGVQFDAGGSDPDGDALSYGWDFGDGSADASGSDPSHTYPSAGSYTAIVTAHDGHGMSATASVHVTVPPAKPQLRLTRLSLSAGAARLFKRGVLTGNFNSADAVRSLRVSFWRGKAFAKSCRWWSKRAHAFKRGSCKQTHWMTAKLSHKGSKYTWKLPLGHRLGKGSYSIVMQALPRSSQLTPSARITRKLRVH
jgi:glucose/arabinose dehydrogenase